LCGAAVPREAPCLRHDGVLRLGLHSDFLVSNQPVRGSKRHMGRFRGAATTCTPRHMFPVRGLWPTASSKGRLSETAPPNHYRWTANAEAKKGPRRRTLTEARLHAASPQGARDLRTMKAWPRGSRTVL